MNRARFSRRQILSEVARRATRFSSIFIDGVEVNQAIQYRKAAEHLTDPGDRAPDNSIRLVADKPAMVRVYVHSMRLEESGVTGKVTVQRRRHGIWIGFRYADSGKPLHDHSHTRPGVRNRARLALEFLELHHPSSDDARPPPLEGARRGGGERPGCG